MLDRLVKKINSEVMRISKGKSTPNMLHASKQSEKIRRKLFNELILKDVQIDYICLDKTKNLKYLSIDKHKLYLDLTISLIGNVLKKNSILSDKILLMASKEKQVKI